MVFRFEVQTASDLTRPKIVVADGVVLEGRIPAMIEAVVHRGEDRWTVHVMGEVFGGRRAKPRLLNERTITLTLCNDAPILRSGDLIVAR